jgi:uncharacterized protein (DUF697 family)
MLPKNISELDAIRDECKSMVTTRASISAGAAIIPLPGVDIGGDIALLVEMIPAINRKFGLTPEQIDHLDPQVKKIILVAITSIGSELIGKYITKQLIVQVLKNVGVRLATKSVAKYIPILGSALAATVSFGAMKMVGNSHVDDCYDVAKKAILAINESSKNFEKAIA